MYTHVDADSSDDTDMPMTRFIERHIEIHIERILSAVV